MPELADEEDETELEGMLPCVPLSPEEVLVQAIHMFREDEDDRVFMVSLPTPTQLQARICATESVSQHLAQSFTMNSKAKDF